MLRIFKSAYWSLLLFKYKNPPCAASEVPTSERIPIGDSDSLQKKGVNDVTLKVTDNTIMFGIPKLILRKK